MSTKEEIIDEAINMAVAHIQDHLDVEDGGFAGLFFTTYLETLEDILGRYYDAEVENREQNDEQA